MNINSVEVLLVADDISDAELMIRELKNYNMANSLLHVKNGQEAIEFVFGKGKFQKRDVLLPPKIILLDMQMPDSWVEVLQRMKNDPLTKAIPVVVLASSKEREDVQRCYELGANSYVVKPADFEGFACLIKNLGFYWLLLNQPLL